MCDELDYAVRWKAACSCSVQMEENASIACDNSMSFNWMFARHLFFSASNEIHHFPTVFQRLTSLIGAYRS